MFKTIRKFFAPLPVACVRCSNVAAHPLHPLCDACMKRADADRAIVARMDVLR